jgi:hypothetical protein
LFPTDNNVIKYQANSLSDEVINSLQPRSCTCLRAFNCSR